MNAVEQSANRMTSLPLSRGAFLIVALSGVSLALMLACSSRNAQYLGVLFMFPLSFIVFGAELYLWQSLFRALKKENLGLAWASGHLVFIAIFSAAMYKGASLDPIQLVVWLVPAVIDLPVTLILFATAGFLRLNHAQAASGWFHPLTEIWLPSLVYAVLGSLQYYLLGTLAQRSQERRCRAAT